MASKEAKKVDKEVRDLQDELHPDQVVQKVQRPGGVAFDQQSPGLFRDGTVGLTQTGVPDEQFPADYTAHDKRDEYMDAKLKLQKEGQPGVTAFGIAEQSEDDIKWLLKKQAAAEEANFEQWFAQEYDRLDPASKEWAREALPRFYSKREQLLKRQTENLHRLASIKLHGIRSKKDLMTMYALDTGRLDVGPLQNLLNPETTEARAAAQDNFKRGLMNPRRFYFGDEGPGDTQARRRRNFEAGMKGFREGPIGMGYSTGFPPLGNTDAIGGANPDTAQGIMRQLGGSFAQ